MDTKKAEVQSENNILKEAIKNRGTTQLALAEQMGCLPSAMSQIINRRRMTMDKFKEVLDALDYDIYIVDRKTGEAVWTLDVI